MGWARRLQASQGIVATVGMAERQRPGGERPHPEEIDEVSWTLDLLRKSARGTFPRQKLIALLDACGAPQGEGDIQQAERIYYRGQAAALLSVDRRWSGNYREDDRLIEQLLSDNGRRQASICNALASQLQRENSSHGECPASRATAAISRLRTPLRLPKRPRLRNWLKISSRRRPSSASGMSKTQRQVRSLVATFVEMIGDDHVRSLAQSRIAEYRSLLLALPRTYGKGQNDRNTTSFGLARTCENFA